MPLTLAEANAAINGSQLSLTEKVELLTGIGGLNAQGRLANVNAEPDWDAELVLEIIRATLRQGAASGSGQAGAGAGAGAAAELPQIEYLRQPMRSMKYTPGTTGSSSTYLGEAYQYELSFWDLEQEAAEVEAFLVSSLGEKTVPRRPAATSAQARKMNESEAQTNVLFLNDVCERINNIYDANGVFLSWTLDATSENDPLRPDFRLLRPGAPGAAKQDVMVGEGKRLRYGFLTSYNLTFFFKRLGDKQYAMSNGMERGETEPSVAAVLYNLSEKSRLEGLVPDPNASLTPVPLLASSSRGPQQQGSGQHGQGGAGAGTSHSTPGGEAGSEPPFKAPRLENQRACSMQLQYPEDAGVSCSRGPRDAAEVSERAPGAGASCSRAAIPEHALVLGGRLGWGGGGVVHRGRLYDQEVAVKGADACNSRAVVQCLRHEGAVLAGRLQSLQGVCVPVLHACGYWECRLTFVLATAIIDGRHPEPGEVESPGVLASAQQALSEIHARGVAHGDIREQNILITHDDKVFFIDFGASVLDPSPQLCATEMQELHSIFAALGSPNSDKTTHQGS